jgi:hypothetical protein
MTFGSLHDVEVLCRNVGGLDAHIHILCVKKLCAASAVISVKGVDSYNELSFRAWSDDAAGPLVEICIVLTTSVSRQYKTYTGMTASASGLAKLVTSIVYTASSAWVMRSSTIYTLACETRAMFVVSATQQMETWASGQTWHSNEKTGDNIRLL